MKIHKNYADLSAREKLKITQGSIIPRPIAWITTINENGSINLAPFSYFAVFSPTLVAVSFTKLKSRYKDTYVNIMREKEAVIHLGSVDLLAAVDQSSENITYNKSELETLDLNLRESEFIKTPYLEEALVSFEVKLEKAIQFNDDSDTKHDNDVVFMRIINAHLDDTVYDEETGYIDAEILKPISRLGGPNYATIKGIDFKRQY